MKLDKNLETQESVCLEYAGSETKLLRKELILQHQVSPKVLLEQPQALTRNLPHLPQPGSRGQGYPVNAG